MATKTSFYSNTGTTTNNIASITSLTNAATTAKTGAETAQVAAASSASAAAASAVTAENAIQTNAEVRTAVEAASDSNVFTDADHSKLNGVASSANNYAHPTGAGNNHVPTGGSSGQFLKYSASGVAVWAADNNDNTTYSVGDGGLTQNNFTNADHTKLDGITASANNYAHPNHSGEITSSADGATVIADNIVDEANLKVSNSPTNGYILSAQSGNTGGLTWVADTNSTYSVGDGGLTQNNFTDADHTKLNGIAASANNYAHPTGAGNNHVPTGGSSGQFLKYSASGVAVWAADNNTTYSVQDGGLSQINFTSDDHTKLNAIEASATADQTNAEIRAAVEAASDSNVFTDADHTKLNAVPASIDEAGTAVAMAIALG